MIEVKPGNPYPLGATLTEEGVNFAVYSENAQQINLELFKSIYDSEPFEIIELKEKTEQVWHVFVPGLKSGSLYGYRAFGPYDPERGLRFNKNKLLIDPYAKSIGGKINWSDALFGYKIGDELEDLTFSDVSDTGNIPKCAVVDDAFEWGDVQRPNTPWSETIIYETHVKGLTYLRKDLPEYQRGTYLDLSSKSMIDYFHDLGITAVEIMPVQHRIDNKMLVDNGLNNYWGYNTIGFFAPDIRFSSQDTPLGQVREFKQMVKNLHDNGIEVIMDVVYNHTAEGNHLGPTISFRGLDNSVYYRLNEENPRFYDDFTGTGNSLNVRHPQVLQLIMDSLRYWITEMHVDGFRFDLASALARQFYAVDRLSAFFDVIHQDPVISKVKLIAEPWDVGPGGYQVGNFPVKWAEWNGKYRDSVRRFWRGDDGLTGEFATRLSGSPDLYENSNRKPHASINYITSHDGFTLLDLVSYLNKHNELNKENNADGTNENYGDNFGVEGQTDNPEIINKRIRRIKNLLTTLMVSQGAPMILGGDEILRTQRGNNNAYCQDNEISWYNWSLNGSSEHIRSFMKMLIALRATTPCLRRKEFFSGDVIAETGTKDVHWFNPAGKAVSHSEWTNPSFKALSVYISGMDSESNPDKAVSPSILLFFNAGKNTVDFSISDSITDEWEMVVNSFDALETFPVKFAEKRISMPPDSSAVLRSIMH
ncbi:MAG: glycogen debranching protein GlgX [Candidatus Thermoplasmatota archaeon]|nr:glycogen debranching protein GlgX [Candidatus Thermoplasmatota archaeon]